MKWIVNYEYTYRRLVPRPPIMYRGKKVALGYSIRCAKFATVKRPGQMVVRAKDRYGAQIEFYDQRKKRRRRGDTRVVSIIHFRPEPIYQLQLPDQGAWV